MNMYGPNAYDPDMILHRTYVIVYDSHRISYGRVILKRTGGPKKGRSMLVNHNLRGDSRTVNNIEVLLLHNNGLDLLVGGGWQVEGGRRWGGRVK